MRDITTTPHQPHQAAAQGRRAEHRQLVLLAPQVGLPAVIAPVQPAPILNLRRGRPVHAAQTTSVIFTASRILQADPNPNPGTRARHWHPGVRQRGSLHPIEFDLRSGPSRQLQQVASLG